MKQLFSIIICLLILWALPAQRKKSKPTYTPAPTWVSERPIIPDYYIGISSAAKKGYTPATYIATAQRNALADLTSSISIKVESSSALTTIQNNDKMGQHFMEEVKTFQNVEVEGYEMLGTWEDENFYWVYYRLSRAAYKQQREAKKTTAIADAFASFQQAENFAKQHLFTDAFLAYTQSLSLIKSYLTESTPCVIAGTEKDLAHEIYSQLLELLHGVKIQPPTNTAPIVKGIKQQTIVPFRVVNEAGDGLSRVPITAAFSGTGLLQNKLVSDAEGQISCTFQQVRSINRTETLTLGIDMLALVRQVADPFVRNIVKGIKLQTISESISLIQPTLTIIGTESTYNQLFIDDLSALLAPQFSIQSEPANFIIRVKSTIDVTEEDGFKAQIQLEITLTDSNGNSLYRKQLNKYGVANSEIQAVQNAQAEVQKTLQRMIATDIVQAAF